MYSLLALLARLPLPVLHALGALLGLLGLLRPRHRAILAENLGAAGLLAPGRLRGAAMELGKGTLELLPIWLRPLEQVTGWVREVRGWEHVEAARRHGKGIIVLGPHLGCLELAGLYIASRLPITALYRRPRQAWVHRLMQAGRNRGQAHMVEPNLAGVRALFTALKRNEAAWVLPDQRANTGEGVWAPFFGRWAYMPTLLYRLHAATGATPLLFCCERLPRGRGYRLDIEALPDLPADSGQAVRLVNGLLEERIRRLPAQYLWTYRLHRQRHDDTPPEGPAR
jgi:KDO2-lipid IV(A) lauroyltransferase